MKMKKILYILAAAICILASCEKFKTVDEKIVGDWHCSSADIEAEIYVTFNADKTFVLYQQITQGAFRVYNGTYQIAESEDGSGHVLSGEYNDGKAWGAQYELSMADSKVMTLTAEGITETYEKLKEGIPTEVKGSSAVVVKSEGSDVAPFL